MSNSSLASSYWRVWIFPVLLCLPLSGYAHAELEITGTRQRLQMEIKSESVDSVIQGLDRFGVTYRSGVNLGDTVSGRYAGSLGEVIHRLLGQRYDYVFKSGEQDSFLLVLRPVGSDNQRSHAANTPTAPASPASVEQPRLRGAGGGGLFTRSTQLVLQASNDSAATAYLKNALRNEAMFGKGTSPAAQPSGSDSQSSVSETIQRATLQLQALTAALKQADK
jgi:hypothetical protein